MEAYLDNSATTRCLESVRDIVVKTMMEDFGNPSSRHLKGVEAERYLREAREIIAGTLKVNEKEIYFYFRRYGGKQLGADRRGAGKSAQRQSFDHNGG